jgi:hypothetical protein
MTRARLAAAAVVLHEFLHEFREPAISFAPGVKRKDTQSFKYTVGTSVKRISIGPRA